MAPILFILFMAALAAPTTLSQDVDTRTGGDKTVDGGQSGRSVYAQRHLSPHRMMHFGKKAEEREPASFLEPIRLAAPFTFSMQPATGLISASQLPAAMRLSKRQPHAPTPLAYNMDLLYNNQQQQILQQARDLLQDPINLHLYLDNGKVLSSLPLAKDNFGFDTDSEGYSMLSHFNPKGQVQFDPNESDAASYKILALDEQQQAVAPGQKSMRLTASNMEKVAEAVADAEQLADGAAISIDTRSKPHKPSNRLVVPSYFIPTLYNKPTEAAGGVHYVAFNKKAEPKDNLFMHFGRK